MGVDDRLKQRETEYRALIARYEARVLQSAGLEGALEPSVPRRGMKAALKHYLLRFTKRLSGDANKNQRAFNSAIVMSLSDITPLVDALQAELEASIRFRAEAEASIDALLCEAKAERTRREALEKELAALMERMNGGGE